MGRPLATTQIWTLKIVIYLGPIRGVKVDLFKGGQSVSRRVDSSRGSYAFKFLCSDGLTANLIGNGGANVVAWPGCKDDEVY